MRAPTPRQQGVERQWAFINLRAGARRCGLTGGGEPGREVAAVEVVKLDVGVGEVVEEEPRPDHVGMVHPCRTRKRCGHEQQWKTVDF